MGDLGPQFEPLPIEELVNQLKLLHVTFEWREDGHLNINQPPTSLDKFFNEQIGTRHDEIADYLKRVGEGPV